MYCFLGNSLNSNLHLIYKSSFTVVGRYLPKLIVFENFNPPRVLWSFIHTQNPTPTTKRTHILVPPARPPCHNPRSSPSHSPSPSPSPATTGSTPSPSASPSVRRQRTSPSVPVRRAAFPPSPSLPRCRHPYIEDDVSPLHRG